MTVDGWFVLLLVALTAGACFTMGWQCSALVHEQRGEQRFRPQIPAQQAADWDRFTRGGR